MPSVAAVGPLRGPPLNRTVGRLAPDWGPVSETLIAAVIGALATVAAATIGIRIGQRSDGSAREPISGERPRSIRITNPPDGAVVPRGRVEFGGTFSSQPSEGTMYLVTSALSGRSYWPQVGQPIEFSEADRTWRGSAWIEEDCRVLVVTVGSGGFALFGYYQRVGEARNEYMAIQQLPADVVEHHRIGVRAGKS